MSFATDLASLKTAINSFGDLIKNKFLTMIPASDKGALNGVAPLVIEAIKELSDEVQAIKKSLS